MNRKSLFTALTCALLVFSMLGCGASNKLQSVQISTSNLTEANTSGLTLPGMSYQLQLYTWANYSNGKSLLLHGEGVTYKVVLDPIYNVDAFFDPLPTNPAEVMALSATGNITSQGTAYCTWVDTAQVTPTTPAPVYGWAVSGQYDVTATFQGITSPPVAIALSDTGGSAEFPPGDPANLNNPDGLCGPSAGQ